MEKKYLSADYWTFVMERKDNSDLYRRIYNRLNKDMVGTIIQNGNSVYVEGFATPKYIIDNIEKWIRSKGLTFLRC